jgi:hypothetical protein
VLVLHDPRPPSRNAAGIDLSTHAVLAVSLVDQPGHPTQVALDRVLAFLAEQLRR